MLHDYLKSLEIPDWAVTAYSKREKALAEVTSQPKLEVVIWEATRRCDLKCLHCGTPWQEGKESQELSTSQVRDVFKKIDDAFGIGSLTSVSITGGEPTVRNDLAELVGYIHSLGASQIVIHTNGHRISRNISLLPDLVSAGITGIGVNLDGMAENHNWLRQNDHAFPCSLQGLEGAKNCGVDTMVSTVVSSRSLEDLVPLRNLLLELQPGRWRLIPLEPIGRARKEDLLSSEMLATVVGFVLDTRANYPGLVVELGCGQWYGKKLEGLVRTYIWHCIAGLNVMGILHDGMIGACNNIDRSYCQGNVLEDDIREVWNQRFQVFREREWCRTGECLECIDWGLCKGGEMHLRDREGKRLAPCFFRWLQANHDV